MTVKFWAVPAIAGVRGPVTENADMAAGVTKMFCSTPVAALLALSVVVID